MIRLAVTTVCLALVVAACAKKNPKNDTIAASAADTTLVPTPSTAATDTTAARDTAPAARQSRAQRPTTAQQKMSDTAQSPTPPDSTRHEIPFDSVKKKTPEIRPNYPPVRLNKRPPATDSTKPPQR